MARNKLQFRGTTYDRLSAGSVHLARSLLPETLEAGTLSVTVETESRIFLDFVLDEPVVYLFRGRQMGIFYLQSVQQVSLNKYSLYATDAVGLLTKRSHPGGLYAGQTVEEICPGLFGPIPYYIKTNLRKIKLYGWLPYVKPPDSSARDNLLQILFAIGAVVKMDRDGAVRIEGLWDGIIADAGKDRMGQGASTVRDAKVTSVSVTEHQYVPGTESVELFEGTAQQGDEIRFDEPVHSLSAEGFTILESGANYARLSAGNGTLTGLAYRHNTRIVTKPVHEAQTENGKDFGDKTLVSLVNSDAVAQRLANYYGSYDRIQAPMVYRDEIPGDRLSVYHPYDKEMVSACLESADITMSNKLKGDETLLVGFTPPSSGEITYETQRVVLTGRGIWQRPDGVTLVTYVLIGGAQGGKCGSPGSDGGEQEYFSYNTSAGNQERGYRYGPAGVGGEGGEPGHGGKILQGSLDVSDLDAIPYQCGPGGVGAPFHADSVETEGSEGGDTTFGDLSSASGSVSETGYTDTITGEQYALGGTAGTAGGDSAGKIPNQAPSATNIQEFQPAPSIVGPDGTVWSGGSTLTDSTTAEGVAKIKLQRESTDESDGAVSAALGSGAAVGAHGTSGTAYGTFTTNGSNLYPVPTDGLAGANAVQPPKAALTMGGDGGHGGGGGSPGGLAGLSGYGASSKSTPGPGGSGSAGGDGGDGIIILYFNVPVVKPSGPLVTKTPKWFNDKFGRRFIV